MDTTEVELATIFDRKIDENAPRYLDRKFGQSDCCAPSPRDPVTPPVTKMPDVIGIGLFETIETDLGRFGIHFSFSATPKGADFRRSWRANDNRAYARLCMISLRYPVLAIAERHGWDVDYKVMLELQRFWLRVVPEYRPPESLTSLLNRASDLSSAAQDYLAQSIEELNTNGQELTPVEYQDCVDHVIIETLRLDGLQSTQD